MAKLAINGFSLIKMSKCLRLDENQVGLAKNGLCEDKIKLDWLEITSVIYVAEFHTAPRWAPYNIGHTGGAITFCKSSTKLRLTAKMSSTIHHFHYVFKFLRTL